MRRPEPDCLAERPQDRIAFEFIDRTHLPAVMAIECASFERPWFDIDFRRCLRHLNCVGEAALFPSGRLAGFCIYELHQKRIQLLNLAVDPIDRRRGVGRQIVQSLINRLGNDGDGRTRVMLEIRETNLGAQLFFRALGFRCVSIVHAFYHDTPEDAYRFQYRLR